MIVDLVLLLNAALVGLAWGRMPFYVALLIAVLLITARHLHEIRSDHSDPEFLSERGIW